MLHKEVTIVREVNGIGITSNLIGYHIATGQELRRAVWQGRLVYIHGKNHVGYATLKKSKPVNKILMLNLPF